MGDAAMNDPRSGWVAAITGGYLVALIGTVVLMFGWPFSPILLTLLYGLLILFIGVAFLVIGFACWVIVLVRLGRGTPALLAWVEADEPLETPAFAKLAAADEPLWDRWIDGG